MAEGLFLILFCGHMSGRMGNGVGTTQPPIYQNDTRNPPAQWL